MTTVVSVKFRNQGKAYYFDPKTLNLRKGDHVVVETSQGLEYCEVVVGNHEVEDEAVVQPLRSVARLATENDNRIERLCTEREKEAFIVCKQKIADHELDMKLIDVECSFDGSKILFFFSSEGRVDFRELVKDLASCFRTRIELRQIGVRDEARMLGGLGLCGRPFCCGCFMDEFAPVSTKMAKTQSLSLNPTKISGTCGRLMCCLRYEQEAYEELIKNVPKVGAFVETTEGYGNVTQVNILRQEVRVKLDESEDTIKKFGVEDVATIPEGRPKDGTQPPHVLENKPKKEKLEVRLRSSKEEEITTGFDNSEETEKTDKTPQNSKLNIKRRQDNNRKHNYKKPGNKEEKPVHVKADNPVKVHTEKPQKVDNPNGSEKKPENREQTAAKKKNNYYKNKHRYYKNKKPGTTAKTEQKPQQ